MFKLIRHFIIFIFLNNYLPVSWPAPAIWTVCMTVIQGFPFTINLGIPLFLSCVGFSVSCIPICNAIPHFTIFCTHTYTHTLSVFTALLLLTTNTCSSSEEDYSWATGGALPKAREPSALEFSSLTQATPEWLLSIDGQVWKHASQLLCSGWDNSKVTYTPAFSSRIRLISAWNHTLPGFLYFLVLFPPLLSKSP